MLPSNQDGTAMQGGADTEEAAGGSNSGQETEAKQPLVSFVKRRNRGNIRKRPTDTDDQEVEGSGVVRKPKTAKDSITEFTTKRPDKFETFKFESSKTIQQRTDGGATRTLETETAFDRDARAIREKILAQATGDEPHDESTYKGMAAYKDYRAGFRREHTIASEKGRGAHGPLRTSVYVKSSIRVDYQPDICKDYKETGYCGYGDACKFLHDRGDYKMGWEIDREWEEKQKLERERMEKGWDVEEEEKEEGEEDDLPFACYICRRPWEECESPVVTRCHHYFCEQCALRHNAKSKKCFVCEQPTNGIFNVAQDIAKRLKEKKRQAG